jgi:PIN domain nuclease of toxin-antitoxin system
MVSDHLLNAHCSAVNLAETLTKLVEYGFDPQDAKQTVGRLKMTIHAFDEGLALEVAVLRSKVKEKGLSFGDSACLALTRHLGIPVLTGDKRWQELDIGLDIRLIR